MPSIKVKSPKYGEHEILFDECDSWLVSSRKWYVAKDGQVFYAHAWDPKKHRPIPMHRLILGLTDPKVKGDHINNNGLDNRRQNLRLATNRQNSRNRRVKHNATTGLKGVGYKKTHKKFCATIFVRGKTLFGGYYDSAIDAAKRYNELALKHYGEFASLNPINEETICLISK